MDATLKQVKTKARFFLAIADRLNKEVSAYLDGSNAPQDRHAYERVIAANKDFNRAYTTYYGEPMIQPHLDYELAESVL